jgi:hypothetical protein
MKMTGARVDYLHDLMDAAYDAGAIYKISRSLGHVPIFDKNPRGREGIPRLPMKHRDATNGRRRSGSTVGQRKSSAPGMRWCRGPRK